MSWRYKGGFIQEFFDPLTPGPVGDLYSWGLNNQGQLAQNDTVSRSSPVQVGSLHDWTSVNAIYDSDTSFIAIKSNGALWAWGYNGSGQLGQNNITNRSSPVQIGALTNWSSVQGFYGGWTAKTTTGTIFSCGYNTNGQLGLGDVVLRSSPVQVGALNTWSVLASGYCGFHRAAIKTDGTLWVWGYNVYGELGQNNRANTSSPVQVGTATDWANVSCGVNSTIAVKNTGTLWSWGNNTPGVLAQNDTVNRSSPVQVGALTNWANVVIGGNGGGTGYTAEFSMFIKTDGTLWGCGYNNFGELGTSNIISRSSPVQIGSLNTWLKVSCGDEVTSAIRTDGTLWTWGVGGYGVLGQNNTVNRSSPVQIGSLTNWSSVAVGSGSQNAITTYY